MADELLFVDSFDHYSSLAHMQRKWNALPNSMTFVTGRSGSGQAVEWSANQGTAFVNLNGSVNPIVTMESGYWTQTFGGSVFETESNAGAGAFALTHVGDGRLRIDGNGMSSIIIPGFSMLQNTWYFFGCKFDLSTPNLLRYEVRANNGVIASGSAACGSSPGHVIVTLIPTGSGNVSRYDDFSVTNGPFLGDGPWQCIFPNAPGLSSMWGTSPVQANWINTKEHDPDDFTTFNQANALSDEDLYNMDDIGLVNTIVGIQSLNCVAKSAAGVSSVKGENRTNGVTLQDSEFFPSFGSWIYQRKALIINPVTGLAWTPAEINAMQRGAIRIS